MNGLALIGLVVAVAAPAPKEAAPPLVGTWVCDGKTLGAVEPVPDLVYEFTAGGILRVRFDGRPGQDHEYRTDTTVKPAEIDWLVTGTRQTMRGIFKVDGDRLTICWHDGLEPRRPSAFESPAKSVNLLLTFKRVQRKD